MVARGTLVSAVDIPLAATMAVATTADSAPMAGMVVTAGVAVAVTDGEADLGAIHATVGAGDGVLALGGRIGDGDTLMATYSPSYYAPYPYYYPAYCPPGYWCPSDGNDDPPPPNSNPKSRSDLATPWRPSARTPGTNYPIRNVTAAASRAPILSVDKIDATTNSHRVPDTAVAERSPNLRPEVQKAMRALSEMPPFARERAIETGRYSRFSPEEREVLRNFE